MSGTVKTSVALPALKLKNPKKIREEQEAKAEQKRAEKEQMKQREAKENRVAVPKKREAQRVVYVSHLPRGLFELQLKKYFEQFGEVVRVSMGRNKKTGRAQHFAFVEFVDADVARIAAATMDGYIVRRQRLKCQMVDMPEDPVLIRKIAKRNMRGTCKKTVASATRKAQKVRMANLFKETPQTYVRRLAEKEKKRAEKLKSAGIEYSFDPETLFAEPKKVEAPATSPSKTETPSKRKSTPQKRKSGAASPQPQKKVSPAKSARKSVK